MAKYFSKDYTQFFKELAANNNKEWFDANRERYLQNVKKPFENFMNDFLVQIKKIDQMVKIEPKDAIFRINRDIRFSKDKTPYKICNSALISPKGRKGMMEPGFYFEFGPEHIEIYGGLYSLDTTALLNVRKYIAKNLIAFNSLITDKTFIKEFGNLQGEKSSRINPELKSAADKQSLILNKQFYFGTKTSPNILVTEKLLSSMLDYYKKALPLIGFFRKGV